MNVLKNGFVLITFGIICFITALFFDSSSSSEKIQETFSNATHLIGPIETKEKNQVIEFVVKRNIPLKNWSHIEASVLNEQKELLYSFGDELWHESGRDSDGPWVESKKSYNIWLTFQEPGKYYFEMSSESSTQNIGNILVTVNYKAGSPLAFYWIGLLFLILGIAIIYFSRNIINLFLGGYTKEMHPVKKKIITKPLIYLTLFLALIYVYALSISLKGWGYTGYNDYNSGSSFFYYSGPTTYSSPSNRDGSIGGPNNRGGGYSGGK